MILSLMAGCAGMCVLIGPTLLALANSPPITAATSWTPLRLLAVRPFYDLGQDGCSGYPPVHAGPVAVQGRVVGRGALENRFTAAVFACAAPSWAGDVTISAAIDARGVLTDVHTAGTLPPVMQRCLSTKVVEGEPLAMAGPGTLQASYFMGHRYTRPMK